MAKGIGSAVTTSGTYGHVGNPGGAARQLRHRERVGQGASPRRPARRRSLPRAARRRRTQRQAVAHDDAAAAVLDLGSRCSGGAGTISRRVVVVAHGLDRGLPELGRRHVAARRQRVESVIGAGVARRGAATRPTSLVQMRVLRSSSWTTPSARANCAAISWMAATEVVRGDARLEQRPAVVHAEVGALALEAEEDRLGRASPQRQDALHHRRRQDVARLDLVGGVDLERLGEGRVLERDPGRGPIARRAELGEPLVGCTMVVPVSRLLKSRWKNRPRKTTTRAAVLAAGRVRAG